MTNFDEFTARAENARALWYIAPGECALRAAKLPDLEDDLVRVRVRASGVSRGTERLVCRGKVPQAEWQRMRAPFQEGDFPFPVKYGYAAAGIVEAGPDEFLGSSVFCLYPHQSVFTVSAGHVVRIPSGVPLERAVLAANMETALNALWDGMPSPGDHICVVGGGVVGLLTAYLAARIPATRVTLVDVNPVRRDTAEAFGCLFAPPEDLPQDQDLVFHTSATAAGLQSALTAAGDGATVIEMSWYGDAPVPVVLGSDFHSRRLVLKSSQVGSIRAERRDRWNFKRRLETAMSLLADPVLDRLISHRIPFDSAPERLPDLFNDPDALATVLTYE
ncbi:zinc-binding alcohol dehydrogenase [uncultured Roseibium sp.]|uniref:zinc-dependent alcohol dehydrogenase n=1 Tax=uncultured Roseibium sp. TaxID=1936171 RepID=UPI0032180F07